MPQKLSFGISTLLALSGLASAVGGIVLEEFKLASIGFVLLFGATVFALLFLGTKRDAPDGPVHADVGGGEAQSEVA